MSLRLLAYQKRSRVRLSYAWKELWSALIALAKFVASNESSLVKKMNIFAIGHQVWSTPSMVQIGHRENFDIVLH